jgi:hypothetical protein
MSKQSDILRSLATHHGITYGQAEEIWTLFNQKIREVISNPDKKTDGLYDVDKFKTIHIDNFGKFTPITAKIRYANYCLEKNKKDESNS